MSDSGFHGNVYKAYAIVLFKRLHVAYQTLRRACERSFVSPNFRQYIRYLAQSDCLSWNNKLAVSLERVAHALWFRSSLHVIHFS